MNSSIEGSIRCKNQIDSHPCFHIQLNRNIVKGKEPSEQPNPLYVDDMNFHDCMNLEKFESERLLSFNPPEGEFTALNYRMTTGFHPPFTIRPMMEEKSETKIELILQIRADFEPDVDANNVFVSLHAPHDTTTCSITLAPGAVGQVKEYRENEHRVLWMISKVSGQKEYYLKVIFNLEKPANQFIAKEIGPIAYILELNN